MTDKETQAQSSETGSQEENVSQIVRDIVRGGGEISSRIARLFKDKMDKGTKRLDELVSAALSGAQEGLDNSMTADKAKTIKQVVDGIESAVTSAANSTKFAIEEAKSRGNKFVEEDVVALKASLGDLEKEFINSISSFTSKTSQEIGDQLRDIVDHAKRSGTSIRGPVEESLKALISNPGATITEGTAVALQSAGGLLQRLGESLLSKTSTKTD